MKRLLIFTVTWCLPFLVSAQFTLPETTAQLEVRPTLPAPGQTVTVRLNDHAVTGTNQGITWYINGEEQVDERNQRSLRYVAGGIGEDTTITAVSQSSEGQQLQVSKTIPVAEVILIVEADTYTPTWYTGRAAPSIGSTVTVTAFPRTGGDTNPAAYSYQWRIDDSVLQGGTLAGGYQQQFTMPLGRGATVAVEVYDAAGALVARKSQLIESHEPELLFYTVNPLRGVEHVALPKQFTLIGEETSIRAEAFFVDRELFTSDPIREWSVNRQTIDNPNEDQQVITLRNAGGTGSFLVEYHLRNPRHLLQGVEDGFNVQF